VGRLYHARQCRGCAQIGLIFQASALLQRTPTACIPQAPALSPNAERSVKKVMPVTASQARKPQAARA
jgi:hypothetical protein